MTRTIREFLPGDRYSYDFGQCSYEKGFAQIDTPQDASYFGTWVNPTTRTIVNYCEGDVTIQIFDTDEELADALRLIDDWNMRQLGGHARIDPGLGSAMAAAFVALGVGDLLH